MEKPRYFTEIVLSVIALWLFSFVSTNVNTTLGMIYQGMAATSLLLLLITSLVYDKNVAITVKKQRGGSFKSLLIGIGGWIVLLITSVFALKFIAPASANFGSVLNLLSATTPAFANSKIMNLIIFALAVPYVETQLWSRMLEFLADIFHTPVNKQNLKRLLITIIILSFGVFLIFHATAKGIENIAALVIVGIMMFISLMMVVFTEETLSAIFLHITANSFATILALFSRGELVLS
jgi:hypothetical protein